MTPLVQGALFVLVLSKVLRCGFAVLPHFPDDLANNPEILNFTLHEFDRIVGGKAAEEGQFPYQVSIQHYSRHFCGGSIVAKNVVLSAAHCARGRSPKHHTICSGSIEIGACETHAVKRIIVHPDYSTSTLDFDASIWIIEDSFDFNNPKVAPVVLPGETELYSEGKMTTVSGWGTLTESGQIPDHMYYVEVPLVNAEHCKESYGASKITESMICAGYEKGSKDSCQGDSGGPLVDSETKTLLGIVSWGYGCARPNYPGVYGNVAKMLGFIQKEIRQEES